MAEANDSTPPWKRTPFAGAFGQHGIHFFTTHDSDNAFSPKPLTEIVGQQWRFSIPMSSPINLVKEYGNNVSAKLQAFSAPFGQSPASASPSPSQQRRPPPQRLRLRPRPPPPRDGFCDGDGDRLCHGDSDDLTQCVR